jgi:hypothetical protein
MTQSAVALVVINTSILKVDQDIQWIIQYQTSEWITILLELKLQSNKLKDQLNTPGLQLKIKMETGMSQLQRLLKLELERMMTQFVEVLDAQNLIIKKTPKERWRPRGMKLIFLHLVLLKEITMIVHHALLMMVTHQLLDIAQLILLKELILNIRFQISDLIMISNLLSPTKKKLKSLLVILGLQHKIKMETGTFQQLLKDLLLPCLNVQMRLEPPTKSPLQR